MAHDSRQLVALWNRAQDACENTRRLLAACDQQVRVSKELIARSDELMRDIDQWLAVPRRPSRLGNV